jgi:hypothetical protein
MQNLKSLNNLLTQPVLGANDDTNGMVGRPKVPLYTQGEEVGDLVHKINESYRSALSSEILVSSKQN